MNESSRKRLGSYALCIGIALALSLLAAVRLGLGAGASASMNCRHLSDGFFIVGVVFTGVGLLTWVSTTGFFDMFGYAMKSLLVLFSPLTKIKEHPKFYDYKTEKETRRKKPLTTILFTGLGLMAASLICLALYYKL